MPRTPTPTPAPRRRLIRRFDSLEAFQDEYRRNIANGGTFVPSELELALREVVEVELALEFSDESVVLQAEVVTCVTSQMCGAGGRPGVAVQFTENAERLRQRLGALAELPTFSSFRPSPRRPRDERAEERAASRVKARIDAGGSPLGGRTQNLSRSGVMLSVEGTPLPIGSGLELTLVHPTTGEEMQLGGTVVRHGSDAEGRSTLAISFEPATTTQDTLGRFIADVQSADHARRLGAITGPIETLGLPNLVQMFSSCVEAGTLTLLREGEEGTVVFASGVLRHVRLGPVSGPKALARLFLWKGGSFEFLAQADAPAGSGEGTPIYSALMETAQQADEMKQLDASKFPPAARLALDGGKLGAGRRELNDAEAKVVAFLASRTATVAATLDGVDTYDARVYRALTSLRKRGLLQVEKAPR